MIARGFQPVAWVAAIGTAALGCYMLSLQVAAERSDLARLDRQIITAQQDIRSLQTELGTRGRLQQLEQWNAEVLALSAPVAGQYLESGLTLARFDTRDAPGQVHERVRLASAETAPSMPATAPRPAVVGANANIAVSPLREQPLVRRASLELTPAAKPNAVAAQTSPQPRAAAASSLLDDQTLRELGAQAQSESEQGAN